MYLRLSNALLWSFKLLNWSSLKKKKNSILFLLIFAFSKLKNEVDRIDMLLTALKAFKTIRKKLNWSFLIFRFLSRLLLPLPLPSSLPPPKSLSIQLTHIVKSFHDFSFCLFRTKKKVCFFVYNNWKPVFSWKTRSKFKFPDFITQKLK